MLGKILISMKIYMITEINLSGVCSIFIREESGFLVRSYKFDLILQLLLYNDFIRGLSLFLIVDNIRRTLFKLDIFFLDCESLEWRKLVLNFIIGQYFRVLIIFLVFFVLIFFLIIIVFSKFLNILGMRVWIWIITFHLGTSNFTWIPLILQVVL